MKEISATDIKNTVATAALPLLVDISTPQCGPADLSPRFSTNLPQNSPGRLIS
ncbi:MAG: hypothetical protein NTV93_17860 [Verrucomicrobia bacterium]|nr:hypothetical protein [Verrucomicrobiota bacterium]